LPDIFVKLSCLDKLNKKRLARIVISWILAIALSACNITPAVSAQDRLFLDLSLEFIGEYQLPKITFKNTIVGGLSGIAYDRQENLFYAVSDDRSNFSPARFYTLNVVLNRDKLKNVEIKNVTFLTDEKKEKYSPGTIDSEGIALSPRGTVFISSEGDRKKGIDPFIGEFELKTGQLKQYLRIPRRYLPDPQQEKGIQNNKGFESLTLSPNGLSPQDPFRLFTAIESSLIQDGIPTTPEEETKIRMMHYVINPFGDPVLVSEQLYLLDRGNSETVANGLSEMLALPKEGFFLSLERSINLTGYEVKIYQVAASDATDISPVPSAKGDIGQIRPLRKKLLLNLDRIGIELDNLEGMTFGPRLSDGSQSLILVSDDNFNKEQITQFLLFKLIAISN
jgi:hypothetical protein